MNASINEAEPAEDASLKHTFLWNTAIILQHKPLYAMCMCLQSTYLFMSLILHVYIYFSFYIQKRLWPRHRGGLPVITDPSWCLPYSSSYWTAVQTAPLAGFSWACSFILGYGLNSLLWDVFLTWLPKAAFYSTQVTLIFCLLLTTVVN